MTLRLTSLVSEFASLALGKHYHHTPVASVDDWWITTGTLLSVMRRSPAIVDTAVNQAKRLSSVSKLRQKQIIFVLCNSTASDAAIEGSTFLRSCSSGNCHAQGDLLPKEAVELLCEIQTIFQPVTSENAVQTALPELKNILYKPLWKPRSASPCLIPGVSLVPDACGRVQR